MCITSKAQDSWNLLMKRHCVLNWKVSFSQLMTYLKLTSKKLGLLVNFKTTDISKSIYRRVNNL
jgi:hypothetical protein